MNLFDIPSNKYSHPDEYQYNYHIKNIANSFNDSVHKILSNYHDIGKLCDEFQEYISSLDNNKRTTHALESAYIYLVNNNLEIDLDTLSIFISILRHHGNLKNINEYLEETFMDEEEILYTYPNFNNKINKICQIANIELSSDLIDFCELFDTENFIEDYKLKDLKSYFRIKEVFSQLIFGDKYEAIFKQSFKEENFINSDKYINNLLTIINTKQNDLSNVRNQARKEILNNFNKNQDKSIFIIEAPTGLGKTFASLHLALEIAKIKNKKRIINALPMTSIIDQTHLEYSKIIDEKDLLKFHHLTYSKDYSYSENERDSENKEYQKDDFLSASWALDNIIITTFNQLFNAFYSNKNKDLLKFWTLKDSVIILDEIQSIPRVLFRDVSQTINYLSKQFNIDFILMSATIPAIKEFLDSNLMVDLLETKYFSMAFNNRYILKFDKSINEAERLANEILKKSKKYNSILCVVNTKRLSLNLFEILESNFNEDELILLNTNFIPLHRKEIIENVGCRLKSEEKTILISTQVVEAGVDLDFDYGFREFAPLSSIIQTAGRINREGGKQNSKLIITSRIGNSPYDDKDLLYEDVEKLLANEIQENNILAILKDYFNISINKTTKETLLIEDMEKCNFENVIKTFNNNFMKNLPYLSPIFIETEIDLYRSFKEKMDDLLKSLKNNQLHLEEKMNTKSKLKNLNKEISKYIINIPSAECREFERFYKESDIFYCPYSEVESAEKYSFKKGWVNEDKNCIVF